MWSKTTCRKTTLSYFVNIQKDNILCKSKHLFTYPQTGNPHQTEGYLSVCWPGSLGVWWPIGLPWAYELEEYNIRLIPVHDLRLQLVSRQNAPQHAPIFRGASEPRSAIRSWRAPLCPRDTAASLQWSTLNLGHPGHPKQTISHREPILVLIPLYLRLKVEVQSI